MTDFERLALEYLKSIDNNINDVSFQLDALQRHFEPKQPEGNPDEEKW